MATLQVLKGSNVGKCYELTANESLIGRYNFCDVALPSHTVSRQHARIVHLEGNYFVEDLNSLNGTYLNGDRVRQRTPLRDKDRIRIHEIVLMFHIGSPVADEPAGRPSGLAATQEFIPSEPELEAPGPQPVAVVKSRDVRAGAGSPAIQDGMKLVLKLSHTLAGCSDINDVLNRILDGLFEVFPQADRGHILFSEGAEGSLIPRAVKHRHEEAIGAMTLGPLSNKVARRVMVDGEAMLSMLGADEDEQNGNESVLSGPVRTMMCAPLLGPSRTTLGIIYVDTNDTGRKFTEDDLQLLVSVGIIGGQAVEFAFLLSAPSPSGRGPG